MNEWSSRIYNFLNFIVTIVVIIMLILFRSQVKGNQSEILGRRFEADMRELQQQEDLLTKLIARKMRKIDILESSMH